MLGRMVARRKLSPSASAVSDAPRSEWQVDWELQGRIRYSLAPGVHDLYFEPKHEEFWTRTMWSLSDAFTSAFQELDPIPQFKAIAMLGEFLDAQFSWSF